jgi:hypothetical protein
LAVPPDFRRALLGGLVIVAASTSADGAHAQSRDPVVSTPADRTSLAVTIYNNGVGLVRESRRVQLTARGRVVLDFKGVAPTIQAPSVALSAQDAPLSVAVVEQSYRYDVLSPESLTRRAAGLPVSVHRVHPGTGQIVRVPGKVLADFTGMTPVLSTDEGITFFGSRSALGFGALPERWVSEPMLSWQLDVRQPGTRTLGVSYLAAAMKWSADYIFVLGKQPQEPATLVGWITLVNRSGASFDNAHLAVVAGTVHMATPLDALEGDISGRRNSLKKAAPAGPMATRSSLSDYHLYDIPNATNLPDQSSKQVTFLLSNQVRPQTRYLIGERHWRHSSHIRQGATTSETAETELRFDAKKEQGLGVPLPAGNFRVFAHDSQGNAQFVGQASIDHTPKDETVKLHIGAATEIRLVRKLIDRRRLGGLTKDTVTYQLRNAKPVAVRVDVVERAAKLDHATVPATHPDARTTSFTVDVPAGGEVTWRAEYTEGWR